MLRTASATRRATSTARGPIARSPRRQSQPRQATAGKAHHTAAFGRRCRHANSAQPPSTVVQAQHRQRWWRDLSTSHGTTATTSALRSKARTPYVATTPKASPAGTDTNAAGINASPANCTTPIAGTATTFARRPAAVASWNQRAVIGSSTISIASVATARASIGLARRLHRLSALRAPCARVRGRGASATSVPAAPNDSTQPASCHASGSAATAGPRPPRGPARPACGRPTSGAARTTAATLTARATDAPPSTTAAKAIRPIASHHRPVRTPSAGGTRQAQQQPARWRRCRPRSRPRDTRPHAAGPARSRGPDRYDRR